MFHIGDERMAEQITKITESEEIDVEQGSNGKGKQNVEISDSKNVSVTQLINIRRALDRIIGNEKDKTADSSDEIPREKEPLYWEELISEIRDIFKSVYQKYREESESEMNSKTLAFLKHKLHDLAASRRPFKWLDVGCGYGRALDVLDAVNVPRNLFEYHGIDVVYKYFDATEEQAKKYKLVNPKIEKNDAARMDFDSEFNLISAVLLLHEVDPLCLPYVIKNMLRALKPDGTLVISDFQGPYEREEEVVAWSTADIKRLLENICNETKVSFESMPADSYPEEFSFYSCYVKKSNMDDKKFETFMENYHEFLEQKKKESRDMRNKIRKEIKERVEEILGRYGIDTKNMSSKDVEQIKSGIGNEYGIRAYKVRLLDNQIDFLDCKIQEFRNGINCSST